MKILITSFLLISTLFAELHVGESFPKLTLVDQFDSKTEVKKTGSTTLILSFEKDVSSAIKTYLDTKEKNFLPLNNVMYISDISGMPSFITSWIAIPKMKKFNFKVSLISDEKEGIFIDRKEGKVTVITLKDNTITSIEFIEAKNLDKVLNRVL